MEIRTKETLEKALKRLTTNINAYLKDPDLAYIEAIATELSSLLCDGSNPYLLKYAENINYPLYIFHGIPERDNKNPGCIFSVNFTPIGTQFMTQGKSYSLIEEFLGKVAFRTPHDTMDDKNFLTYKNLIGRIRNKDGYGHLAEKLPQNYAFLKGINISSNDMLITNAFVRPVILNIGKWAQIVINFFLGMADVRNETEKKLKLFANSRSTEPATFTCTFDQVPYLTASLYFEGNNFALTELDKIVPINEGVSLFSLCKILPQIHSGSRTLFEFQNENNESFFRIELGEDLTMSLAGESYALIKDFQKSNYFNSFSVFAFNLHSKYFEFYIDGEKIKSYNVDLDKYKIKKISYSGSIEGSNTTSCLMAEVAIVNSFLAEQFFNEISKTLYKRYYDFIKQTGF